jgi:hypothetical protein
VAENFKHRQTHGPEKVSKVGQPGKQMEHSHAPKTPMQPGHRQVRKHPDPGAKHPHSPPNVKQMIHGGRSAPSLVTRQIGSQARERMDSETLNPPSHGMRSRSQVSSGGQALRPNPAGSFFLGQVNQPRVMGKLGKLIKKQVGSSMHGRD